MLSNHITPCLDTFKNGCVPIQVVRRGMLIALNVFIKNLEKSYTSDFTVHLKALEQNEADTLEENGCQEIN